MGKDVSGNSTGKDTELDALLSAADGGMLDAIRDNLDLDTGLAQILGDLAGVTPTGPADAEPGGHAHGNGHALDPVPACRASGAGRTISAPAGPEARTEPRYHRKTLTTLALAVVTALNIALLCSLSHNHGAAIAAPPGVGVTRPIGGEPARDLCYILPPRPQRLIVLAPKAAAFASLIGLLCTGAGPSCRTCSAVSHLNRPFPPAVSNSPPERRYASRGAAAESC
jgi:hypothetical protein